MQDVQAAMRFLVCAAVVSRAKEKARAGRTEAHTPEAEQERVVCEERVGDLWIDWLLEDAS